jgi:spore coat protein U-like protein
MCLVTRLVMLIVACLLAAPASAVSCRATMTNINFGSLSAASLVGATAIGTLTESCDPGFPTTGTLAICNALMGGVNAAAPPHPMMNGTSYIIHYRLYRDAAMTSEYVNPESVLFTTPYSSATGSGTITQTVYAKIVSAATAAGTYIENWGPSGTGFVAFVPDYPAANPCDMQWHNNVFPNFTVSVTVVPSCSVGATSLTFPSSGVITPAIAATATITAFCSLDTPYTISLSAGLGAGATTLYRKMTGPGGTIDYQLFRDPFRTQIWGDTVGVNTLSGTGSGGLQTVTVYGATPTQPSPPPGLYRDTVIVTMTY